MEYLGYVVSNEGVSIDKMKVKVVLEWLTPKSIKGLRGFLGLTGYYHKFIKDYEKIAKLLSDLLKEEAFRWNAEAQKVFNQLRSLLTRAPVLALLNFNKPFAIECNALGKGIGVVLLQESPLVAYFSKVLVDKIDTKSTYEKELMALCYPYNIGDHIFWVGGSQYI